MPLEQIFYKGPQKQTLQSVVLNAILSDGSLFEEEKGGGGAGVRGREYLGSCSEQDFFFHLQFVQDFFLGP